MMTQYAPKKCEPNAEFIEIVQQKMKRILLNIYTNFAVKITALRDIYLTFRALDKSADGILSREEFYRFYEVSTLRWKPVRSLTLQKQWTFFKEFGVLAQKFLNSPYSNHLFSK